MAGFENPIVGGIALRKPAIRSPNYVAGSTGWTVNVDGSAEFSNAIIRGTITASVFQGTDFVVNSSGEFFYSGPPALNNLVLSITQFSGTDAQGNVYLAGYTSYDRSSAEFVNVLGGIVTIGALVSNVPDTAHAAEVRSSGNSLQTISPTDATNTIPTNDVTGPGQSAASLSSGLGPTEYHYADSATDLLFGLKGAAVHAHITGGGALAPDVWQLPSYGTNWSGSTTFNGVTGVEPLRFRIDAEDNLWPIGAFKAGGVVPADPAFILPAGYIPAAGTDFIPCLRNNGGVVTSGMLRVSSNGHVDVLNALNLGIAANNEFLCNGKIPLRNIS